MTVSSSLSAIAYSGDGATASFPTGFAFLDAAHVKAALRHVASGAETPWAQPTQFTVTGAGDAAGGVVVAAAAPAAGTTLTIWREVPATQETDYVEGDAFPAASHERALDKLTMIAQQIQREVSRSFRLSPSDPSDGLVLPDVELRKGKYLLFDALSGAPAVGQEIDPGSLSVSAFMETVLAAASAGAARALLEAPALNAANTFLANEQRLQWNDAGGSPGPTLRTFRNSASPASGDFIGSFSHDFRNASGAQRTGSNMITQVTDPANGSEDATIIIQTSVAGGLQNQMFISSGVYLATATGDGQGQGTINATGYFRNGAALPVQRLFESGDIAPNASADGSVAHGLGVRPKLYMAALRCLTAELGYAVGDEVSVVSPGDTDSFGVQVGAANGTANLFYAIGSGGVRVLHKTSNAVSTVTPARWALVLRAWA